MGQMQSRSTAEAVFLADPNTYLQMREKLASETLGIAIRTLRRIKASYRLGLLDKIPASVDAADSLVEDLTRRLAAIPPGRIEDREKLAAKIAMLMPLTHALGKPFRRLPALAYALPRDERVIYARVLDERWRGKAQPGLHGPSWLDEILHELLDTFGG